jgi:hypothetical protein
LGASCALAQLLQYPSVDAIIRGGQWNTLRHGLLPAQLAGYRPSAVALSWLTAA